MGILAIVLVLLFLVVGPVVVVNRDLLFNRSAAKRKHMEEALPFLIIPTSPGAANIHPTRIPNRGASMAPPMDPQRANPHKLHAFPESAPRSKWVEPDVIDVEDVDEEDEIAQDATIVFTRPVDEPLQILPGRLQVLSGEGAGEDLRLFSRLGESAHIIVGRDMGPPHQHITLRSPTVSRRHACMEFDHGHWNITNLSETNPVLVNDRVLGNGSPPRRLADGDRIELGDVALRFLAI